MAPGLLHDDSLFPVFTADVEEGSIDPAGMAGDRDAFKNEVRITVTENAILEGTWFCLIAVDSEVAWLSVGFGEK